MSQVSQASQVSGLSRFFRVAPFDASVFLSTLVFIGALGFFAVRCVLAYAGGHDPDNFDLGASVLLTVIIAYAFVRSVKGYRLGNGELVIERLGPGRLHIALGDIESAEIGEDLGSFVRSNFLSIQGLFGWAGKIHVRKPTDAKSLLIDVYGTNPSNAVLMSLKDNKRMILTPRDVQGFMDALRDSGVGERRFAPKKSYLPPVRKKKKK